MTPTPNMTTEQLEKCREAFHKWIKQEHASLATYEIWQAAWQAAQPKWLPIDDKAKQGQGVLLGGYVHGEWCVMNDDWYIDRVMADWREWSAVFDEPPTHYMPIPTPPSEAGNE